MTYKNPAIPEGINYSQEHPLKEFAWLLTGAVVLIVVAVIALSLSAGYLVRYIPFKTEQAIAASFAEGFGQSSLDDQQQDIQDYLQTLANTLASHQGLPEDMGITVHYVDDEMINAFATLGGHVFIFKGLLKELPHENALSMVMAHEIAHIKHRDPIVALGRGITVLVAMASIAGVSDNVLIDGLIGQSTNLTILTFSRRQETAADTEAHATLESYYGHLQGATALFVALKDQEGDIHFPEFFNTHPMTDGRIQATEAYAAAIPTTETVQVTPLPNVIRRLQKDNENDSK